MNNDKIARYVGFAVKSGKIVFGLDNFPGKKRQLKLVLADITLSGGSLEKAKRLCSEYNIPLIEISDVEGLTGKSGCKAAGITEDNLSKEIIKIVGVAVPSERGEL